MSQAHEKCPFCPEEFKGKPDPSKAAENAFLQCSAHVWLKHSLEMFLCPRQINGVMSFWRHDGTCSYCNSITPEAFFMALGAGDELVPTDKDYQVYVSGVDGREFKFNHMNEGQKKQFIEFHNEGKLNMPESFYILPYFMMPPK